MTKVWLVLGIVAMIGLGVAAVKAAEADIVKPVKECTMKDLYECTQKCTMICEKNTKNITEAMASLDKAVTAIDAANTADAKAEIEKAKMLLKDVQLAQKKCIEKMPVINDRCPITGKKIDIMNTPEHLTALYNGKKVGFCCPACPPMWEKLTEKEKAEKLEKVIAKMPGKEEMLMNRPEVKKIKELQETQGQAIQEIQKVQEVQ